jgi:hypothetical protein
MAIEQEVRVCSASCSSCLQIVDFAFKILCAIPTIIY